MKDYRVKRTDDRRPLVTHVEMSHISPDPRGNEPNIALSLRAQQFSLTHTLTNSYMIASMRILQ